MPSSGEHRAAYNGKFALLGPCFISLYYTATCCQSAKVILTFKYLGQKDKYKNRIWVGKHRVSNCLYFHDLAELSFIYLYNYLLQASLRVA